MYKSQSLALFIHYNLNNSTFYSQRCNPATFLLYNRLLLRKHLRRRIIHHNRLNPIFLRRFLLLLSQIRLILNIIIQRHLFQKISNILRQRIRLITIQIIKRRLRPILQNRPRTFRIQNSQRLQSYRGRFKPNPSKTAKFLLQRHPFMPNLLYLFSSVYLSILSLLSFDFWYIRGHAKDVGMNFITDGFPMFCAEVEALH